MNELGNYRVYYGKELICDSDELDIAIQYFMEIRNFYEENELELKRNLGLVNKKYNYTLAYCDYTKGIEII